MMKYMSMSKFVNESSYVPVKADVTIVFITSSFTFSSSIEHKTAILAKPVAAQMMLAASSLKISFFIIPKFNIVFYSVI